MESNEEIQAQELRRYAVQLRELVAEICTSSAFRTSPRSCEFLRHIVDNTLEGNVDSLKERLIGMTLLGRDASYDTGADAGVRVRANDVRKRLGVWARGGAADKAFAIDLPPGAYVPRFFRRLPRTLAQRPLSDGALVVPEEKPEPRLPFFRVAGPTLAALFLCTICLRWQATEEHPFTTFWQSIFQSRRVILYLPSEGSRGNQVLVGMQELRAAAPLFNVAGQFHRQLTVVNSPDPNASPGDVVVSIGSSANAGGYRPVAEATTSAQKVQARFALENTAAGRAIVDRSEPDARAQISGDAALLTIDNGVWRSIQIDGTNEAAIDTAIQLLAERASFPETIVDSFQKGTITQVVIPVAPPAAAKVFHESPAGVQVAAGHEQP